MSLKLQTTPTTVTWSSRLRPKVGDTVTHNGSEYTNTTGINSEPGIDDNWLVISGMEKKVYDPTNKQADAFSMTNMVEGVVNKILTNAAQTIEGVKTFTSPLHINNVDEAFIQLTQDTATASLSVGAIVFNSNAKEIEVSQSSNQVVSSVQVELPITSGTLALTSDIPPPEDTLLKGANGRYNLGTATYYADNAAAITGGLVVGDMYVTPTGENRTVV